MLNINIVCIGKLKESFLRDGCQEYIKRMGGMCRVSITEFPEYKLPDAPSEAEILSAINAEGADIIKRLKKGYNIALCIEGELLSSEELSSRMALLPLDGVSNINLIIGGSYGLSGEVKSMADLKLSMSRMTLPHQLCRLVLLEQLYRAFAIKEGRKYHK